MNIVAVVLGFLGVMLGFTSVVGAIVISRNTDKLIETEDARAKQLIDEGNKRVEKLINKMDDTSSKMDNTLSKIDDTLSKIDDTQKYTVSLIAAEGSKTRELIKEK